MRGLLFRASYGPLLVEYRVILGLYRDNGKENGNYYLGFRVYGPLLVDRLWLWVKFNKIPIYSIFYLLKGDYRC